MIDNENDQISGSTETFFTKQRAQQLRTQFEAIDLDHSGMIRATELAQALKSLDLRYDDAEIQKIISEIDYYGNGMINYTEFIAATLAVDEELNDEQLWSLFKKFDVDNTDFITVANLKEAFKRLGRLQITQTELDEMISIHDLNHKARNSDIIK